jgi:hypothetical protein
MHLENNMEKINFKLDTGEDLPLLQDASLARTGLVQHCFSTRGGGVSEGIFSSMNLSFTRGDDSSAVLENYRRIAQFFGKTTDDFICTDQTHTTNVRRVGRREAGSGVTRERPYTDVDGLVTDEAGVILSAFFADCVPLYFVDPAHRAIGLSHSGWRGTVGRMGRATLEVMAQEFGTRPEDVRALVGPSICMDCYEVSADVADAFYAEFPGHEQEILLEKGGGKYQLDLWKANELVLLEAGVRPEHLAVAGICTCCHAQQLFSHRASRGKRGNLGAFLMLYDEN